MAPMEQQIDLEDILADARRLIEGAAHPTRRTLSVSPEVAGLLERVQPAAPVAPSNEPAPPPTPEERELAELEQTVSTCARCRLCEGRTQAVFGDGSPHAELVFVGEAPVYE